MVYERLEGWWNKNIIEALCSEQPVFMTQFQVNALLVELGQQYAPDNLPIDTDDFADIELSELGTENLLFYEQLKLICLASIIHEHIKMPKVIQYLVPVLRKSNGIFEKWADYPLVKSV